MTPRRVQEMLAVARSHSRFASAVVERFVPLPPPWTAARLEGLGTRPLTIAVLSREFRPHVMMHLMQDTLGSRAAGAQLEGRGVRARGGLRWELFALNPLDSKAPIMAKIYAAVTTGGGAAHELLDHSFLEGRRRRRFGRFAHSIPCLYFRVESSRSHGRGVPLTSARRGFGFGFGAGVRGMERLCAVADALRGILWANRPNRRRRTSRNEWSSSSCAAPPPAVTAA